MMRSVFFDISGSLEAFDYKGVLIHTQEITKEKAFNSLNSVEPNHTTKN
ncbi:hypothetical protein [Helicobacter pylori]|nr:hypothetical protein [Helicobacter pylori]